MYGCHEPYLQIFTHKFFSASQSIRIAVAATPIVFSCSTWSFIMASRARQATMESSSLLFITDLNTALLVERSLTAAISYISSASVMLECWQNLSKLTNQKIYHILVYRNDLLLSFPTGVLSLPLAAFFLFFLCAVFCTAPWLTERLEEANSWGITPKM